MPMFLSQQLFFKKKSYLFFHRFQFFFTNFNKYNSNRIYDTFNNNKKIQILFKFKNI